MSNLFGGGSKTASMTATRAMGIQFTSSQYGPPVPVVYGTAKVGGTCMWYGDFRSQASSQKVGKGGGSTTTGYTYSASFMMGLCEGPIAGIGTVFDGTSTVNLSSVGAVVENGTVGQAAWSHLSGAFAIGYSETAWLAVANLNLGSSASLPNWNPEIKGLHIYGGTQDANPADILNDICTNASHGINFPWLGDLTAYSNYCLAAGLLLSPCYEQEQTAQQTLEDLLKYTNSAAWFSEGMLKVQPYGDTQITGNGVTYSPSLSALFNLGEADYIVKPGDDPITITRKSPADCMNIVRVEYQDRSNSYHNSVVEASIDYDVVQNGGRADTTESVDICKTASVARMIAQFLVQQGFYIRNTYEFTLGWRYCMLEPMDIVTLTDANTGLNEAPVRITEISEDEDGNLKITAEEFPEGVGHAAIYNTQPNNGATIDPNSDPGAVNPPYLFRMPGFMVGNSTPEIGCAVCGSNALWGGADVYLSHDGTSYNYMGTIAQPARYGSLTTALAASSGDPDTTNTPEVTLYQPGQLLGGSRADADNLNTLSMVDTEIISYQTATLVSGQTYQLSYLRRGAYGTGDVLHSAGAPFVRMDDAIFRIPVDPSLIGATVYLKFVSLNIFGRTPRTLAGETAYTYVVGQNIELPDVPPVPAGFGTQGVADGVSITWSNSNPSAVGCTSIERSAASTGPWSVLAQVGPTTSGYTDHFTTGATYYYRARARGPLVSSGWSAYTSIFNSFGKTVANGADVTNQQTGVNVQNPYFVTSLAGWTVANGPNGWYQETGTSHNPNPYMSTYAVHAGSTVNSGSVATDKIYNASFVPVVPGQQATVCCAILELNANAGSDAYGAIDWYDINKNYLSTSSPAGNTSYPTCGPAGSGTYMHCNTKVTGVAPANAAFANVQLSVSNHTQGYYTFNNATIDLMPASLSEVPDGGGRYGVHQVDGNGLAIIDFSQSGHVNKTLDNVGDGATFIRNMQPNGTGSAWDIDNPNFQMAMINGLPPGWTAQGAGALIYYQSTGPNPAQGFQYMVLFSGSTTGGLAASRKQFRVKAGDFISIAAEIYANSGAFSAAQVAFYNGSGAYISGISAFTSSQSWQGCIASGTVPVTAVYAQIVLQCPTANSYASFNGIVVTVNDVRVAGSGAQIGDQRNLKQRTVTNIPAKVPTTFSYTATAGTPATATISVAAFTVLNGSVQTSYSAASVSVTGTNGATVTYYLYMNDAAFNGGSETLIATTNSNDCYSGDGFLYVGSVSVVYPTSGSGSGSGGGGGTGCVEEASWLWVKRGLLVRQMQARDVRHGDYLRIMNPSTGFTRWGLVTLTRRMQQPCAHILTRKNVELVASLSAPIGVYDGRALHPLQLVGETLLICRYGRTRLDKVANVERVGRKYVIQITCEDDFFLTGYRPHEYFCHHNQKPP